MPKCPTCNSCLNLRRIYSVEYYYCDFCKNHYRKDWSLIENLKEFKETVRRQALEKYL